MTSSEREATKQTIIQMVSSLETDGAIDRVYKMAKYVWLNEDTVHCLFGMEVNGLRDISNQ